MRIGIRLAVSLLVLAFITVSAVGVHLLWWRTAEATSQTLAATINQQIVFAVSDELQSITAEAKSTYTAVRTLFVRNVLNTRDTDKRKSVFLAQLQSQPTISSIAFGWPDGSFFTAHKLGDTAIEMIEIPADRLEKRIDRYKLIDGDFEFEKHTVEDTPYRVKDQEWFRSSIEAEGQQWFNITVHPGGSRLAVALAGPIEVDQNRQGVLGIIVELTRVSRFLSQITTGKTAGAFILDRDGGVVAAPDADADEVTALKTNHPLLSVAVDALKQAAGNYDRDQAEAYRSRVTQNDNAYEVVLTPLSLPGWSLATVVPESEFLGPVQKTIRQLLIGLAALIVGAGIFSAWLAQRLIAAPLIKVVNEIKHVERFELDQVKRYPSQLAELEDLSGSIADMAGGLSAFKKYIPADLVRSLVNEGIEPRPGGDIRTMSVMFADIAGFTGLSERLGDQIIPLLSRYLDVVSTGVNSHGGTIDKFIGDAVMAFWGAPAINPDHAVQSCLAALACQRAVRQSGIVDDGGQALRIRIGINSGDMLVGNIGSEVRLNYTVIGDAVNIASRLEGANKQYGTDIIIGHETRRLAGDRIYARELDLLAVYGRSGGMRIYELLGIAGADEDPSGWVEHYHQGLAAYRGSEFETAIRCFETVLDIRSHDGPSARMIEHCREYLVTPPDRDWQGVTIAKAK